MASVEDQAAIGFLVWAIGAALELEMLLEAGLTLPEARAYMAQEEN